MGIGLGWGYGAAGANDALVQLMAQREMERKGRLEERVANEASTYRRGLLEDQRLDRDAQERYRRDMVTETQRHNQAVEGNQAEDNRLKAETAKLSAQRMAQTQAEMDRIISDPSVPKGIRSALSLWRAQGKIPPTSFFENMSVDPIERAAAIEEARQRVRQRYEKPKSGLPPALEDEIVRWATGYPDHKKAVAALVRSGRMDVIQQKFPNVPPARVSELLRQQYIGQAKPKATKNGYDRLRELAGSDATTASPSVQDDGDEDDK